jgi:phage portal protein BeeE
LACEEDLSSRVVNELERSVNDARAGAKAVLWGGKWNWLDMSTSADKLVSGEGRLFYWRQFCGTIGVPSQLLNDNSQTYSNVREAQRALYLLGVLPLLERIADALNRALAAKLDVGRYRVVPDTSQIQALQEDTSVMADRLSKLVAAGLTFNESRAELGFSKVDDPEADILHIPSSLVPITGSDLGAGGGE